MDDPHRRLANIVEAWQIRRAELVEAQPPDDERRAAWLRDFAAAHNAATRQLVRELAEQSPEFWSALRELAGNAHRVMRGDTVWDQVKFWIRDFRDSFGHFGASEHWADELRQIRTDITNDEDRHGPPKQRRKSWRDGWPARSVKT
jgi:hypothetical protein